MASQAMKGIHNTRDIILIKCTWSGTKDDENIPPKNTKKSMTHYQQVKNTKYNKNHCIQEISPHLEAAMLAE